MDGCWQTMAGFHFIRAYGLMGLTGLLLIVSCYQLVFYSVHGMLDDELLGWQDEPFGDASYRVWQSKRPLVDWLANVAPFSGAILQSSSRYYQLGAAISQMPDTEDKQSVTHRVKALSLIRQSVLQQPTWPLAWMDLAFIKLTLGQVDAEFQQAFAMALETGAAEKHVIRGMSEVGFAAWRDLTPENRQLFLLLLDTAVLRERKYVTERADFYERRYILCLLITDKARMERFCGGG